MGVLSGADRERALRHFAGLEAPVTLVHFTQNYDCPYARRTQQIIEDLAALTDRVTFQVVDFAADRDTARRFGVDHVPATVITSDGEFGLRFDGLPDGTELETFLDGIVMMSRSERHPGPRLAVLTSPPTRGMVTRPV